LAVGLAIVAHNSTSELGSPLADGDGESAEADRSAVARRGGTVGMAAGQRQDNEALSAAMAADLRSDDITR
jgi:hypothetical protein